MSKLAGIKKERLGTPLRYVLYGAEGTGKSTLAAAAPEPIFFDVEDGTGRMPVARYPFREGDGGHVPHSYAEVLAGIEDLTTSAHSFQTLVIDTADRLESLLWAHMIARDSQGRSKKLNGIEDYGYGKGYKMALDEWRDLCRRLDRLRVVKGMSVVVLAHAQIRTFKSPETEDYDRYSLRVNDLAGGLLKEWAEVVGFVCFEEGASAVGEGRPKGWSTGRRLVKLQRTAAYDAKSRDSMPAQIEIDLADPWLGFRQSNVAATAEKPAGLAKAIEQEVTRINDPALGPRVQAAVNAALARGDVAELKKFLTELQKRQPVASAA